MESGEERRYVVTLLHGTFQPGAAWTRRHSALCQRLRGALPEDTLIRRVVWSGRNSFKARAEAAARLQHRLRRQADRYPGARHIIVAHSHGGNIALLAIKDEDTRRRVSGIACMATPFLNVTDRNLGPGGRKAVRLAVLALALIMCVVAGHVIGARLAPNVWPSLWYGPAFVVLAFYLMKAFKRWEAIAGRTKDLITLGEFDPDQLLLMRMSGDEASTGLSAMQMVSSLLTKFYAKLDSLEASALRQDESMLSRSRIYARATSALVACVIGVILALSLGQFEWFNHLTRRALGWGAALKAEWPSLYIGAWLVVLSSMMFCFYWLGRYRIAYVTVALVKAAALPVVAVLVAVLALPFGPELAAASLFLEITAEAQPPGKSPPGYLFLPRSADSAGRPAGWLVHSAVYEDDRALDALCRWMLDRAR